MLEGVHRVSQEVYHQRNARAIPRAGDLILAREAPAGNVALIQEGEEVCLGQRTVLIRPNKEVVNSAFLAYYLLSPEAQFRLMGRANGATVSHVNLPIIRNLKVDLPSMEMQERIADLLSHYDSLIENNRRQIKLLEETAQLLYKEWFVDLRFPGHEHTPIVNGIPQGWSWVTYGDVIEFNPKVQLSKNGAYLKVPMNALSTGAAVVDMACCERTTSTGGAKFENGDTLFARITPCLENGKTGLWYSESYAQAVGSTEFIVMRSRCLNPYMVYSIARTEAFRQMAQGTFVGADGRQRAQADKMQEAPCLCPSQSVIQEHQRVVEPLMQRAFLLNRQNRILSEARDRLLPKLMNGEVEV